MGSPDDNDIVEWRSRIDALDLQLIRLLNQRASCAIEIGRIKRRQGLAIYDPGREQVIVDTMLEHNLGPLDPTGVRSLFERIIDESRRVERLTAERKNKQE